MTLSIILTLILALLILILGYFIGILIGLLIPIHRGFKPLQNGVNLSISTNGMHTDFILPAKNKVFDWTTFIDANNFDLTITAETKLGIGWGDKAIYLDIETWGELTIKMGLATLFLPTPTILHITAYEALPTDTLKVQKTFISNAQYLKLCQFILAYFNTNSLEKPTLIEGAGYTPNDNFYQAIGKYHAFNTCNTWVNKGLKKIGIRTALWSPMDKGIFYQFEKIKHN